MNGSTDSLTQKLFGSGTFWTPSWSRVAPAWTRAAIFASGTPVALLSVPICWDTHLPSARVIQLRTMFFLSRSMASALRAGSLVSRLYLPAWIFIDSSLAAASLSKAFAVLTTSATTRMSEIWASVAPLGMVTTTGSTPAPS